MKFKEFFKGKLFITNFVLYVLLTLIIFSFSLTEIDSSVKQSSFVSNIFSGTVKFITNGGVDLSEDGKSQDFPSEINLNGIPERNLMVGESFFVNYSYPDGKTYAHVKPKFFSDDPSILEVDAKTGKVKVLNVGATAIGVKDEKSLTTKKIDVVVGNEEFVPKLEIVAGPTESDGKYYYSTQNHVGSLYHINVDTAISPENLVVSCDDDSAFEFLTSDGLVAFLTKKTGTFNVSIIGKYFNVNSLDGGAMQEISKSVEVTVEDFFLNAPTKDFTFLYPSISVFKNEETKLSYDNKRYDQEKVELTAFQKQLFITYDKTTLKHSVKNGSLYVKALDVGTSVLKIYYASANEIKCCELEVIASLKRPQVVELKTTNSNLLFNKAVSACVVGDGDSIKDSDFIWSSSDESIATVSNGVITAKKLGKVTITATSKKFDGLTISKTYKVVLPFDYVIRKLFGHFLMFTLLAIFAKTVYYRLARLTASKKPLLFSILFTLLAGILTAGLAEIFQFGLFVDGRTASIIDVAINSCGYILGFIVWLVIDLIKNKKHKSI